MKWQVWYRDGSSVCSEDVMPCLIPRREDVQVIIQEDENHGWKTITTDYYVWDDKGHGWKWWACSDIYALTHYLRQPGHRCVLFGSMMEKDDFNRIFNQARKEWGEKVGYTSDERQP